MSGTLMLQVETWAVKRSRLVLSEAISDLAVLEGKET